MSCCILYNAIKYCIGIVFVSGKAQLLGTHLLCPLDKVVRVNGNAMPPDHPRAVLVEVSLRACSSQHFIRADAEPGKDHGELVHEGDVEVVLGNHIGEYLMEMVGF